MTESSSTKKPRPVLEEYDEAKYVNPENGKHYYSGAHWHLEWDETNKRWLGTQDGKTWYVL